MPLIGNLLIPFAKNVSIPLELTAAATATDAAIHRKMLESRFTKFRISNEEVNDLTKIAKSLEESGFLIKGVSEKIKNAAKE